MAEPVPPGVRRFRGTATKRAIDRHGDLIEPLGLTFTNPVSLLLHHDDKEPVGEVVFDPPTAEALTFEATFAPIDNLPPGDVRSRIQRAMDSVAAGLYKTVSLGLARGGAVIERLATGGMHFRQAEIIELSLCTVGANRGATLYALKTAEAPFIVEAAFGLSIDLPASRDLTPKPQTMTNEQTAETITKCETARTNAFTRAQTIVAAAQGEDRRMTVDELNEHVGLMDTLEALDKELGTLKRHEAINKGAAVPIVNVMTPRQASMARVPTITVKSVLPKGTAFTRWAMALGASRGDKYAAIEYAKQWADSTPEVEMILKAAVAPGNTTDATWASPLVPQLANVSGEFLELLRPKTILGRLTNLLRVPFNTKVPIQTGGGTYGWVGEGLSKPVTKLAFSSASLPITKAAGIIVLTEELVRNSSPSAEEVVRRDMIAGIAQFLDSQFIDPAVAAVAGVNPASITNGVTPITATGNPLGDLHAIVSAMAAANIPLSNVAVLMSELNAFALAATMSSAGTFPFASMTVAGGSLLGFTVLTSQTVGDMVIGIDTNSVIYADDGGVTLDVSREASLQMDTAPATPPTPLVSLWQQNLVGIRAERFINWKRARNGGVQFVDGVTYVPTPTP